jgi:Na+-driven multidrug efflux pump
MDSNLGKSFWILVIPDSFSYILSKHLELGPKGVFISIAAETLITIVAFILFRKGKWKTVKV